MGNHRADRNGSRRPATSESQTVSRTPAPSAGGGKRKAVKPTAQRTTLGMPSTPVIMGVAALAISAGGAVNAAGAGTGTVEQAQFRFASQASALNGASAEASKSLLEEREEAVSRDSRRDAQQDSADAELEAAAEAQAQERNAALAKFAQEAEKQAAKIALNAWVLPVEGYRLTNTFGVARSYYSSGYHTGLDFACSSGTPIKSATNGVVTFAGYDGAYGNKTVVTLDDGTEIWYAHQSSINVGVGEVVNAGEIIGTVGSTGNSTGPHLHIEVRPGAGDPVDPYQAFVVHGVTP